MDETARETFGRTRIRYALFCFSHNQYDWWVLCKDTVEAMSTTVELGEYIAHKMGAGEENRKPSKDDVLGPFSYNPTCRWLKDSSMTWDEMILKADEEDRKDKDRKIKGDSEPLPECCYLIRGEWVCW